MATTRNPSSATVTPVAMSTTSAAVSAGSGAVGGQVRYITNTTAAILYLRFGSAAASATDFTIALAAGTQYEMPPPFYSGPIQGILASGTGNANVTTY